MNNELRVTSHESQGTNRAFTLIELVVAIAILAMVLVLTSVIFKVSIEAHRTSMANTEIMQKLRAITDQLNADFKGLRKDAPLLIHFKKDTDGPDDLNRFDQIMFFADGDFQSTQVYDNGEPTDTGKPVRGNVARIFYGQAHSRDPSDDIMKDPLNLNEEDRILARRLHILTTYQKPVGWTNEEYEYDVLSLAEWKIVKSSDYGDIVDTCFVSRPLIDKDDPYTLHKLMCEGVSSFAIQWAYWDKGKDKFCWFPENSDLSSEFGVYFNISGDISDSDWKSLDELSGPDDFKIYPKALKFTFTLYDSKGILKGGREFTHIVYLGD